MSEHRTREQQIAAMMAATAKAVCRSDYPADVYRMWVDRMLEDAEGRGYQRGIQNGREAGITIGRHQAQSVISAAIAVALSEHGVDAVLKGDDPLAFEPWPEMDALLVALDAARPGWRDTARSTAPQPQAAQPDRERLNGVPSAVVQAVAELPNRTSPDDDPDTMLVTTDELASIVLLSIANAMDQEGSGNA